MSSRKEQRRTNQLVRARKAAERRRRITIWTTVAVVAALVIAGAIGYAAYTVQHQAAQSRHYATPKGASTADQRLVVGDGPVTVDVYLDLMCPACGHFEGEAAEMLAAGVANHTITIAYHPVNILDARSQGTRYSTRAGAAAACASDAGQLPAYLTALYTHQPTEGSKGLTDDQITATARQGGVTASGFPDCVRSGRYLTWIDHVTDQFTRKGFTGAPTVQVNGTTVGNPTASSLTAAIAKAR